MKTALLSISAVLMSLISLAQYPVVTIKDIQEVSQANLGNCNDDENFLGDTVIVRGKVVMDGDLAVPSGVGVNPGHKNFWIQQGDGGPFKGIDVFALSSTSPTEDPDNLLEGDSVEITGVVGNFQGESQIAPLDGASITILGQNQSINFQVISVGDLNDDQRNNILTTGEQWEGAFVEVQDVTVVSVSNFGGGRASFDVQDAQGNLMNVGDRFLVGRTQAAGGNFVPPSVGDQFDAIRGIVQHNKNFCPGAPGSRGYELQPFKESHYDYGASAPAISNISRTPAVPGSSQDVTVQATVTDLDGVVTSARVFYTTGASSTNYTQLNMNNIGGDTYEATIPAQNDGTLVKWYIQAEDDSALLNTLPNSDPNIETYLYRVRDNGLTIFDLQFTPFSNGNSPFNGETVTVEGVVTASQQTTGSGDLGFVYIQQENQPNYAGIWLRSAQSAGTLGGLERGDKVTVEGVVEESFGMTSLSDITSATVNGTGNIDATVLDPDMFTSYDPDMHEQYEGMLIEFQHPTAGQRLVIADTNPDAPSNFAEYRIGTGLGTGSRILAGRQSTSAFSSLWVSFVNSDRWEENNGVMNVRPYVMEPGNSLQSVTGIMYYSFGDMKLLPRNNEDFVEYSGPVTADYEVGSDTVCVFEEVTFTNASSIIADELAWDFGNGKTDNVEAPVVSFNAIGTYTVALTATNSFDSEDDTYSKDIEVVEGGNCGVGIQDADENATSVYPNPADEFITVATAFENGEVYSITIYDVQGRQVFNRTTMLPTSNISLVNFEAGTYIMEVRSADGSLSTTERIIKK